MVFCLQNRRCSRPQYLWSLQSKPPAAKATAKHKNWKAILEINDEIMYTYTPAVYSIYIHMIIYLYIKRYIKFRSYKIELIDKLLTSIKIEAYHSNTTSFFPQNQWILHTHWGILARQMYLSWHSMGLHIKYLWTPKPWKMKVLSPKNMGLQPLKIKVVGSQGSQG